MDLLKYILVYYIFISAVSLFITVYDKNAAKKHKWRIPEKTLMLFGLFGGAEIMFITMKIIRHKTKHKKFMLGLPAEIILHIVIVISAIFLT